MRFTVPTFRFGKSHCVLQPNDDHGPELERRSFINFTFGAVDYLPLVNFSSVSYKYHHVHRNSSVCSYTGFYACHSYAVICMPTLGSVISEEPDSAERQLRRELFNVGQEKVMMNFELMEVLA